jgi:hypothetical protein
MVRSLLCMGACVLTIALPHQARAQGPASAGPDVSMKTLADKLGIKTSSTAPDDIEIGSSVTASLASPEKIAQYGIKGMHEGARVTVTRIAPDRLRVEADEMEPVSNRATVTLRVGADGSMTPVPKQTTSKPPSF